MSQASPTEESIKDSDKNQSEDLTRESLRIAIIKEIINDLNLSKDLLTDEDKFFKSFEF